jgi:hypothetical protein
MKYLLVSIAIVIALSAWVRPAQASFLVNAPRALGLNNGLVGWWTFDGKDMSGIQAYDRSGNGNVGRYWNATGTPPVIGKIGQALNFDGVDDYIEIPGSSIVAGAAVTISAWIQNTGWTGPPNLIDHRDTSNTGNWSIAVQDSADVGFFVIIGGNPQGITTSGNKFPIAQWHHLVAIDDGTNLFIYVDGQKAVGPTVISGSRDTVASQPVWLGRRRTSLQQYAAAKMDDVRIYNRALSADEVKRLYNIGGTVKLNKSLNSLTKGLVGWWTFDGKDMAGNYAFDKSGTGNRGTLTGSNGLPVRTLGKIGQGLAFDGSNDYVNISNPANGSLDFNANTSFTISAWIYMTSAPATFKRIFSKYDGTSGYALDGGNNVAGDTKLTLYVDDGPDSSGNRAVSNIGFNAWHHVAGLVNRSETYAMLFVDGVQVANDSPPPITSVGSVANTSDATIGILSSDKASDPFPGLIDDVRIYNRALSSDEIKRLYNLGGTVKLNTSINNNSLSNGLVGWWTFDGKDMSGDRAYDASGSGNTGTLTSTTVTETFSAAASTTYTFPIGVTSVTIETWGAGGGGGGQNTSTDGGSGGGGGAYAKSVVSVSPGQTYNLSIGTGGVGRSGTNGAPGGDSYIADSGGTIVVKACGGEGGDPSTGSPPTTGHEGGSTACSVGNTEFAGGAGGDGRNNSTGTGGGGGESGCTTQTGNAGTAGGGSGGAGGTGCDGGDGGAGGGSGSNGSNGTAPGGGGGGSGEGVPVIGGDGAAGQIKITYVVPDPVRTIGKLGQGLQFDGVDDVVTLPNNASLDITSNLTLSAWIKTSSAVSSMHIIDGYNFNSPFTGYGFNVTTNCGTGELVFWDGTAWRCNTGSNVIDNVFHHVVARLDGTTLTFFIDGRKSGSDVTATTISSFSGSRSIGARSGVGAGFFNGLIDDVRIYNRALTSDEIKRLYNLGR